MFPPNQKSPKDLPTRKGVDASLQQEPCCAPGGCCPGIPLEEPQIAERQELGAGRQRTGSEECASESSLQRASKAKSLC